MQKDNEINKIRVKKRLTKKQINKLTQGVFSTLTDSVLFALFLPTLSLGKKPSTKDVYKTFDEAHALLEEINYKNIKETLQNLRKNGFIQSLKEWVNKPLITSSGRKRLQSVLPYYDTKRAWNGKLYLINYDFDIAQNVLRDKFREYIKRLGAIKLQNSMYISPHNLQSHIEEFTKTTPTHATIFMSELGNKGFIGEKELKDFLWHHADLDKINEQYQSFIQSYKQGVKKENFLHITLPYYAVLKKDPQLPFELLPDEYLGDKAYLAFKNLQEKQFS